MSHPIPLIVLILTLRLSMLSPGETTLDGLITAKKLLILLDVVVRGNFVLGHALYVVVRGMAVGGCSTALSKHG